MGPPATPSAAGEPQQPVRGVAVQRVAVAIVGRGSSPAARRIPTLSVLADRAESIEAAGPPPWRFNLVVAVVTASKSAKSEEGGIAAQQHRGEDELGAH